MTRTNLDVLRAFAVTTVLIDHTALNMGYPFVLGWNIGALGVFGVYLFFVHTCLVLMWSLERRPHTLDFYVRRVFRIYPLAIFAVLLLGIFKIPLYPIHELTPRVFLSNLLLVQDLTRSFYMMGVLWSLPLEVHMYLFLPMLFLFARRERTFWPLLLLWGFAALLARSMFGAAMGNVFISVIPHFLPGVIAYLAYKRWKARWPAVLFLLFVLACCAVYMQHPSVQRGWLVCLALGFLLPLFRETAQPALIKVTHAIAKYSYGMYLLHPFALFISFGMLRRHSLVVKLTVEVLSIAWMSVLAYHLIEHPMVQVGSRVANHMQRRFGTSYQDDYGLNLS